MFERPTDFPSYDGARVSWLNERVERRRREFYMRRAQRFDRAFSALMTFAVLVCGVIAVLPLIWALSR